MGLALHSLYGYGSCYLRVSYPWCHYDVCTYEADFDHRHHYYPALYFAILALGFIIDWFTRPLARNNKSIEWGLFVALYAVVIGLFVLFRAIVFGMEGSHTQWKHLKWFDTWKLTD
jgi:dolichyl-phosphate-mannose-protein mannosyltransferase